jgi:hypothetical protein
MPTANPAAHQTTRGFPLSRRILPVTSVNEADRTVNLVWTSGAMVRRFDWYENRFYLEDLPIENADLTRLQSGTAPFLNTHDSSDLDSVLGVVQSAAVEGPQGTAVVRMSKRPDVEPIFQDMVDQILRNISLGAMTSVMVMIPPGAEGNIDWIYRALAWQPYELSLVPVNADMGAVTRAEGPREGVNLYPCEFSERGAGLPNGASASQRNQGVVMPPENEPQTPAASTAAPQAAVIAAPAATARAFEAPNVQEATHQAGVQAERARQNEIRASVRASTLENKETLIEGFVTRDAPIDAVRAEILRLMAERNAASTQQPRIETVVDQGDTRREAMLDALMHRVNPKRKLSDTGREYAGMNLREMCRSSLEAAGVSTRGMQVREMAGIALGMVQRGGYNSTSDLPFVFGNVIGRTMRESYQAAPKTFTSWARQGTLNDFRPATRVMVDGAIKLEKVNEAGEYKYASLTDGGETIQLATYGKIVAFTRQMIINDDLSALQRVPLFFGRAAANMESDMVYGVLLGNANMSDGKPIFHAAHTNLGQAAAIGIDSLTAGRAAIRLQKAPGDGSTLNLTPKTLLVPAALETVAFQYTSSQYTPNAANQQNPFQGSLTPVVESRLDAASATSWYLMADSGLIDTVEFAYLEGEEGLYTEQWLDSDVDGLKFKGRLDFAAKAIDYRGMYKNPGQ